MGVAPSENFASSKTKRRTYVNNNDDVNLLYNPQSHGAFL